MKQVVKGKPDPVLSGARAGIGVFLCTYNLLICLVPIVGGSSHCSSSKLLPGWEQLQRDQAHVCNGNRRLSDAGDP